MTTTSDTLAPSADALSAVARRGRSRRARILGGFLLGLLLTILVGIAAVYAYGAAYEGRILPGVRVGSVDLAGLDRTAAIARVSQAYASVGDGTIVLKAPAGDLDIRYSEIDRRVAAASIVDAALGVGRTGSPIERTVAEAQTALRGVTLAPEVSFDAEKLSARVSALVGTLQQPAADGSVKVTNGTFVAVPARIGRTVDADGLAQALVAALGSVSTPATVTLDVHVASVPPAVDDEDTAAALGAARKMVSDLELTSGKDHWTIAAKTVQTWIGFAPTGDGRYAPTVNSAKVRTSLATLAKKTDKPAKNASYLTGKSGRIVGVVGGADGRAMDLDTMSALVAQTLNARAGGAPPATIPVSFTAKKPTFTAADAKKSAPLMRKISTWTTYFPIAEKNGFGANIWLPAQFIDGTVVAPGAMFDFWKAVGPVTRARGFKQGGAIINGHTEPQGALAGGICSCSTTLFNAALRAGFEMHARRNHFYYIDRYPLGLDATVFISSSGATQTMSWRNDTAFPVLIRGYRIRRGAAGYVRFDLYSVPNGRKVVIGAPVVKNVRPATDTVQYTHSLAPGARQRVEYPVDGKDVWRTVTVYQNGKVIHQYTYYSHYARITGVTLIGLGTTSNPPGGSPSPSPSPGG